MRLFARLPFDDVTVGVIAEAAEVTPAAVYYHFTGKEQILLEGVRSFSDELIAKVQSAADDGLPVGETMTVLIDHIRQRRTFASVFFVSSAGLSPALEAHRKIVRAELAEMFTLTARRTRGRLSTAEAGVMGAALVSLLEVSASSVLGRDQSFKSLGARRMPATISNLADRIVGNTA
jgi:AcrR family transcriptional regulator